LTEKYKELYSTGVEYHRLSYQALMDAKNCLEKGDVEGARKYLQRSYTYGRLSGSSFSSAAEVYEANLKAGEILARGIKNACEAAVKVGVSVLYPPAATKVDLIYSAFDFVIDTKIEGLGETTKNLLEEKMIEFILKEWAFTSFDHNTFEDYANLVRANVPLDEILTNEEFLEELGYEQLYNALKYKLFTEAGIEFTLGIFKAIHEDVVNYLKSLANSIRLKGGSPVELRVINQEGRITGVVNGAVRHEIPMSYYYNGTITIYFLAEPCLYEVAGIGEGHYSLEITLTKEGTPTTFEATRIPTSQGVLHQYTVNWDAFSQGEEGVTVMVDSDGDGVFEHTFISDSELTQNEYVIATDDIPPQTWLNIGEPKIVVNGITYLTSATPIELIAEDNPGGSGVASTAYRIYNTSYDSGWITYTEPFYLTELSDGTYQIDYNSTDYAGNVESTNTITVFLDNTPPTTSLTIGEPKYISNAIYVTPDTPFTLEADDAEGSGVRSTAYRIYNSTYDSGWLTYAEPFYLTGLTDGVYTIEFNSTDNLGNMEAARTIQVTLFSWNCIFTDSYGRGTVLKINLAHKFFQFITPDKDYGVRKAAYMWICRKAVIIIHGDGELALLAISQNMQLDFCIAYGKDTLTGKKYWLIDKPGIE
jgi:hypothetical protein